MARDKFITVKCSEAEYQRISQGASKSNKPVSSYLRALGTEGRYTKKAKREIGIAAIVKMTQLCNDTRKKVVDDDPIVDLLQEGVDKLWQSL